MVVIASVVVGWIVLMIAYCCWRRNHPKPNPAPRARAGEDGVDLADLTGGVVREEEDSVYRPPQYRRVAKPHEVPPRYTVDLNEVNGSELEEQQRNSPPAYIGTQARRESHWKRFRAASANR